MFMLKKIETLIDEHKNILEVTNSSMRVILEKKFILELEELKEYYLKELKNRD